MRGNHAKSIYIAGRVILGLRLALGTGHAGDLYLEHVMERVWQRGSTKVFQVSVYSLHTGYYVV